MHIMHNATQVNFSVWDSNKEPVQDSSQEHSIFLESPFLLLPLPGPNHPTPRKATPTFPTLRQAHKGLPKMGQEDSFY